MLLNLQRNTQALGRRSLLLLTVINGQIKPEPLTLSWQRTRTQSPGPCRWREVLVCSCSPRGLGSRRSLTLNPRRRCLRGVGGRGAPNWVGGQIQRNLTHSKGSTPCPKNEGVALDCCLLFLDNKSVRTPWPPLPGPTIGVTTVPLAPNLGLKMCV